MLKTIDKHKIGLGLSIVSGIRIPEDMVVRECRSQENYSCYKVVLSIHPRTPCASVCLWVGS